MVKRQVVDQVGGFDEDFFLYGEEIEWCYRIKRHGWRNGYVSDATVIHHESASTGQNRLANRLEFDRGRVRAQLALHGPKAARRSAQLLRLNYALMLGREAVKWAIGHRRELRRNRMAMYWRLLSSSLHE